MSGFANAIAAAGKRAFTYASHHAPSVMKTGRNLAGGALSRMTQAPHGANPLFHYGMNVGLPIALGLMDGETGADRLKHAAINGTLGMMVGGFSTPGRQMAAQALIIGAPAIVGGGRKLAQGYRSGLEARTMAAIPFSHSTAAMDMAASTLSYARARMGDGYSTAGSEAAFFAARYTGHRHY